MIGQTAVAQSNLRPDETGRVLFEGAIWNAVSDTMIPKGQRVSVLDIEGLTLTVGLE